MPSRTNVISSTPLTAGTTRRDGVEPTDRMPLDDDATRRVDVACAGREEGSEHLIVGHVDEVGGKDDHVELLAEVETLDGCENGARATHVREHLG
jgi:hypothetical protein